MSHFIKSVVLTFLKLSTPKQSRHKEYLEHSFRPVFILSTGRTGTKFMADYLNTYEDVCAVHEPKPSRKLRMFSMAHLQGDLGQHALLRIIPRYRSRIFKTLNDTVYIESNPFVTGFVNVIKQEFTNPIIIHVVRDPREYIRSSLNHGTTSGLKGWLNRNLPYFYLNTQKITSAKQELNDTEKIAIFWKKINEFLNESGEDYPYYYRFKFEDLFDENHTGLGELLDLLGLDSKEHRQSIDKNDRINKSELKVLEDKWQEWSAEQCRQVDNICHELMELYGYGKEPEWLNKLNNRGDVQL